ncbi:hypothetical protein [Gimesia fumaroli]|uniref:hypothetical protein n=1 Tax=Gimesia fumaroli TaxID=2527976 RepID=UPI00119F092D|nr:hypothetical protein [Gimesia fumaroli]
MDELNRRLELIEKKTDDCAASVSDCAQSMNECSKNIELMQRDMKHQNDLSERRMYQIEQLLDTQHLVLNGNPRQDTKDRGLIGDVEQLKSSEARKKKLYWSTVAAFIMLMASSFWNLITGSGKEDHGRSEPKETTVQKTGPGKSYLHSGRRSDRRE